MNKFVKFLKNSAITVLGSAINMKDSDIEALKKSDVRGVLEGFQSQIDKQSAVLEKTSEYREKAMREEYAKAGIDYDTAKELQKRKEEIEKRKNSCNNTSKHNFELNRDIHNYESDKADFIQSCKDSGIDSKEKFDEASKKAYNTAHSKACNYYNSNK